MAKKNRVKNKVVAKKPTARNRVKTTAPSGGGAKRFAAGLRNFLSDRRTKRIFGLFILFLCLGGFVAFTAYLFNWKQDQSILSDHWGTILREGNHEVKNGLGPLGAMIGNYFIHERFGIMSYLLLFMLFLTGMRILFGKSPMPYWQSMIASFFAIFIFSPVLAFLFSRSEWQLLGGGFGYGLNEILAGKIGVVGTGLLLAFLAVGYVIVVFNPTFQWLAPVASKISAGLGSLFSRSAHEEDEDGEGGNRFRDTIGEMDDFVTEAAGVAMDDDDEDEDGWEHTESRKPEKKEPASDGFELEVEGDLPREDDSSEVKPAEFEEEDENSEFSVVEAAKEKELTASDIEGNQKDMVDFDPTLELSKYQFPRLDLLVDHGGGQVRVSKEELEENKDRIVTTLGNYKIGIEKIKATIGPTVTLYEIVPEPGVRISRIKNLEDDIALSLSALGIRIIAPIPGRGTIGIEVPNSTPDTVSMRALIASEKFQNSTYELPIALGKTISNETFVTDLARMPHLLMAGATGQGKSVGLNAILVSLLYKKHPSQIKFVLVDPKKVELSLFNKIERHFLAKLPGEEEAIITDTAKVVKTLNSLCVEMDNRYEKLKNAQVRNIKEYNDKFIKRKLNPNKNHEYLPYIVLVIDEFADLIMTAGKEVETPIARLAQLARAIGIHLIIATQRPSVNIITGVIKANFPARIAFRVTSKIDSRTILDTGGADQLIGRGDMLLSTGNDLIRLQCGFVDTPEVNDITEFIGEQRGYSTAFYLPEYEADDEGGRGLEDLGERDPMFEDAARLLVSTQQGSTSLIQRKLKLGYNRAGRIVDQLEAAGIVGPSEGSKARQVLIPDEYSLERLLNDEAKFPN